MRPAKVTDEQLYEDLAGVFRRKGYDGASYSDIMEATGLVKASLYHRFPDGKEQMVNAILSRVDKEFVDYVLAPAFAEGNVKERAEQVAERLEEFYAGGKRWCLLDTLTLAESKQTMSHARRSMEFWVQAFVRIARDAGVPRAEAKKRAQDSVAAIEGGLIASRVLQDQGPFLRAMAGLAQRLTGR
jgi:TetR/AcrR family transcriptional regulator, lmrAB and yxaGH operons repressor